MKKLLLIILVSSLFSKCTSIDISNPKEVENYLNQKTFEYVDYKNNMTSFMQFYKNNCELSVYLQGELASSQSYEYLIGELKHDKRDIIITGNGGTWGLKKDGQIYMYNNNELFIYHELVKK